MSISFSAVAPAKVNLFLHVTGRREDGYHNLESAAVFTEAGDVITVQPAEILSLNITGAFADAIPADANNLVLKAAAKLQSHFKITKGATIFLEKNLPVASGIGGGSSDAATTAKLLSKLWSIETGVDELSELLLPLGADIPACLHARPLLMSGIGEKIIPVELDREYWLLLCNPLKPVATKDVFKTITAYDEPIDTLPSPLSTAFLRENTRNTLTGGAVQKASEIAGLLTFMAALEQSELVRMSGSGASCLALFDDKESASSAEKKLKEKYPDYWIQNSRIIRA